MTHCKSTSDKPQMKQSNTLHNTEAINHAVWFKDPVTNTMILTTKRRQRNRPDPDQIETYSQTDVQDLLQFVIKNTYIQNDLLDTPLRQTVGIPMGSCAAVPLANLYCYIPERNLVDSLIHRINPDKH